MWLPFCSYSHYPRLAHSSSSFFFAKALQTVSVCCNCSLAFLTFSRSCSLWYMFFFKTRTICSNIDRARSPSFSLSLLLVCSGYIFLLSLKLESVQADTKVSLARLHLLYAMISLSFLFFSFILAICLTTFSTIFPHMS